MQKFFHLPKDGNENNSQKSSGTRFLLKVSFGSLGKNSFPYHWIPSKSRGQKPHRQELRVRFEVNHPSIVNCCATPRRRGTTLMSACRLAKRLPKGLLMNDWRALLVIAKHRQPSLHPNYYRLPRHVMHVWNCSKRSYLRKENFLKVLKHTSRTFWGLTNLVK